MKNIVVLAAVFTILSLSYGIMLFEGWNGDVRSMGMGGAFCAFIDDHSVGVKNPAGMGLLNDIKRIGFNHCEMYGTDIPLTKGYGSFIYPLLKDGVPAGIGISWSTFGVRAAQTGYAYREDVYSLSVGVVPFPVLFEYCSVGFSGNFGMARSQVLIGNLQTLAGGFIDVGLIVQIPVEAVPLKIGIFGDKIASSKVSGGWEAFNNRDSLSGSLRVGAMLPLSVSTFTITIAGDYAGILTKYGSVHAGAEIGLTDFLMVRGGVYMPADSDIVMTGGVSILFNLLKISYAYEHNTILGGSHMGSIGLTW